MGDQQPTQRPRRLVFGEVAELYDRRRPGYPEALVDDLAAWAAEGDGAPRALEIGAGTGRATRLVAARGVAVLGIEPSADMAALARRTTAGLGDVVIVESDFERWPPAGRRFPLIYAAQAWHWVDQTTGYAQARAALAEGGHLVAFWNRPVWSETELRDALSSAYQETVPHLRPDGPMHPDNADTTIGGDTFWADTIATAVGLADPEERQYRWAIDYTADEYIELLLTMSEVRLLGEHDRDALLRAVRETVEGHDDRLTIPMVAHAAIARAV